MVRRNNNRNGRRRTGPRRATGFRSISYQTTSAITVTPNQENAFTLTFGQLGADLTRPLRIVSVRVLLRSSDGTCGAFNARVPGIPTDDQTRATVVRSQTTTFGINPGQATLRVPGNQDYADYAANHVALVVDIPYLLRGISAGGSEKLIIIGSFYVTLAIQNQTEPTFLEIEAKSASAGYSK